MDVYTLETQQNKREMFISVGEILEKLGYVKSGFSEALIEREKKWPTGLSFPGSFNVAIPHTDIEFAKKEALIIIKNSSSPFIFCNMENPKEELPVSFVLCIVLIDSHKYVSFLSDIVKFLGRDSIQRRLEKDSLPEILELLIASFTTYSLVKKGVLV